MIVLPRSRPEVLEMTNSELGDHQGDHPDSSIKEGRGLCNRGFIPSSSRLGTSVLFFPAVSIKAITPILNVSDLTDSSLWFEKWGWKKLWYWGTPPTFGAVGAGECEIFLCHGAQGGRGRGTNATTFQQDGDEEADKGVWMSVWVEDVDAVHSRCVGAGLEVTFRPTNMPWNVREMHLRHPDGHVFRVSRGLNEGG